MRFSDGFLDEIRQRLPISQVVGEHVIWDKRKSQPRQRRFLGLLPVPWREEPELSRRRPQGHLPLLRLRGDRATISGS